MDLEKDLYNDMDLPALEDFLKKHDESSLRETLLTLFQKYQHYNNLTEWNKAVRICESLAIIGWGETDGYEALHCKYFNGNPYTCFADFMDKEQIQSAIWSKRKFGFTLEPGRVFRMNGLNEKPEHIEDVKSDVQSGRFLNQRNWLPGNPVKPKLFVHNALPELIFIRDKLIQLRHFLNASLSGHNYGRDLNYIYIWCYVSSEFTQYELGKKVPNSIQNHRSHRVITSKYNPGRFLKKNGVYRMEYFLPKEFGEQSESLQIKNLKDDIMEMVEVATEKTKKKCPAFDFDQMKKDLKLRLSEWK